MNTAARLCLVTLLASGLAQDALAQTRRPADLADATLEDLMRIMITTATGTAEGLAEAPARVQVVTSSDITRRGYRSLVDVLKDLPDFKVELATEPDFPADLTVQGSRGADRIVLLLDGIRVSSPTNEPLPILANYPVHNARQVEILYGPASALYGADAFSAVINIISKDVADAPGLFVSTSLGQFGLYNQTASYGVRLGPNATLMLDGQFLSDHQPDLNQYYPNAFGGLQGQRTGTFNTIFGPMTPAQPVSAAYAIPLSAHSLHATLRAGGLQLSLFENRSRVSTAPAYTSDNAVYNDTVFNENTLLVAAGAYTLAIGRVTSTSTLTFSRQQLDPQSGYRNVYSNLERSYKYAYGSMEKAEEQVSWKPTPVMTVTTGGTFEHFFSIPQTADLNAPIQSQNVPGTILDTTIPDDFIKLRYANTGAYAQMQYSLTPRLAVTLGGRADYSTRYGATFNPRTGFVSRPSDRTTLKLLFGTAYLAPSPYVAYGHYGSFVTTDGGHTYTSSFWHLGNPDLQPQHKRTLELDLHQMLTDEVSVSGSSFYTRFTNLIQRYAGGGQPGEFHGWPVAFIETPINDGRQTTYGGSVGLDFLRSFAPDRRLEAHAALSWADGREWQSDTSAPLQIGAMAPLQLRFRTDVDWGRWSLAPRLAVVGTQRALATTMVGGSLARQTLSGYATIDMNIRRRHVLKNVDAFLTIENALDRRYVNINVRAYTNPEELVGAPQNPRRLTVGFDVAIR
jgi:outer membrane receptor for ferrienterochelin and colicin